MKKTDPGLEHIRQVRHEISAEHEHDPKRLIHHYQQLQEKYSDRLVDSMAAGEGTSEINGHTLNRPPA